MLTLHCECFHCKANISIKLTLHCEFFRCKANISMILTLHCECFHCKVDISMILIYIADAFIVKLIFLWYWLYIANALIVKPIFLWCWFYIANISNVRLYVYHISTSLEIFSIKAQSFWNTGFTFVLHSKCVKLNVGGIFYINIDTMLVAITVVIGGKWL